MGAVPTRYTGPPASAEYFAAASRRGSRKPRTKVSVAARNNSCTENIEDLAGGRWQQASAALYDDAAASNPSAAPGGPPAASTAPPPAGLCATARAAAPRSPVA